MQVYALPAPSPYPEQSTCDEYTPEKLRENQPVNVPREGPGDGKTAEQVRMAAVDEFPAHKGPQQRAGKREHPIQQQV